MWVLNSTNGEDGHGKVLRVNNAVVLSVHYGITVYDIDGDGHLETLT